MVVIKEHTDMFWGLTLDAGKRYTQTVEAPFHVSMAAIEPKSGSKEITSVYVQHNKQEYLLCTLQQGTLFQQTLDLGFMTGEKITLFTNGKGVVHMTGYRVLEEEDEGMMLEPEDGEMSSDLSEEDEIDMEPAAKKSKHQLSLVQGKGDGKKQANKKQEVEEESDEDEEDDEFDEDDISEDDDHFLADMADEDDEEEEDEEDDEEDEEDESDDDDDEEMDDEEIKRMSEEIKKQLMKEEAKKAKTGGMNGNAQTLDSKKQKQTKTPQQASKTPQGKTPKQEDKSAQGKTPQQSKTPQQTKEPVKTPKQNQQTKTPQKRKLPSGITVEELKEGHGPEAKSNKMVHVHYTGKLTSGKVFDSSSGGKPFKFRLGKNEVIKGWEIGLQGMKVGGKRRLTIPPNLAYGKEKTGGIPPNSTLLFDVELKAIS